MTGSSSAVAVRLEYHERPRQCGRRRRPQAGDPSPAAMVVLAHSAVLKVREKTTLRAAFMMPVNGWSAVGKAPAMPL